MISASTGKEVTPYRGGRKPPNLIFKSETGAIEEVNVGTSYNVLAYNPRLKTYKFYKSCYKLDTAHKHLNNI